MLVALVLSFFLILAGYVVDALQSSSSASSYVERIYLKQQSYHAIISILPYVLLQLRREDSSIDTLTDPWALPFVVETKKGRLEINIYDEDRFYNLNYAGKSDLYRAILERLLTLLDISPGYVERLLIWEGKKPGSFETKFPIKGAPLDSVQELSYIGMSREELYGRTVGDVSYPGLLSFVTVHSSGKINVNTAPKYVLMALDPRIDGSLADRIIEYRSTKPFKKPEDLVLVEGMSFDILHRIKDVIDVKSAFFRITITVKTGDVETSLVVVYDRNSGKLVYKRLY